jgi:hypothetical protein
MALKLLPLHQASRDQTLASSPPVIVAADCGIMLPSNNSADASTLQDWTLQPQQGGIIDIIWACVITISLCSWSVLCLNIPAQKDNSMARRL